MPPEDTVAPTVTDPNVSDPDTGTTAPSDPVTAPSPAPVTATPPPVVNVTTMGDLYKSYVSAKDKLSAAQAAASAAQQVVLDSQAVEDAADTDLGTAIASTGGYVDPNADGSFSVVLPSGGTKFHAVVLPGPSARAPGN